MFFLDPTYLCYMAPAFLLMLLTSWYVRSTYSTWSKVPASSRLSGTEAAQRLIQAGNLQGVQVQTIGGELSDNYDPRDKTLHLSAGTARGTSVRASAHEIRSR